jgi:hypothetical protein
MPQMIDQRTIEILSQVVFKSHAEGVTMQELEAEERKVFFSKVEEDTLELARVIHKVNKKVNKS